MLLVHFLLAPTESSQQLECSYWSLTSLKVIEDPLNAEGNRFEVVNVRRHLIDCPSERTDDEQSLH